MPNSLVAQPGVSEGHQLFGRKHQVSLRVIFGGGTQCRLYLLGMQRIPEPCRGGHSHTGPCSCDQPSALSVRLSLQSASPTGRGSAPHPLRCPRAHRALSVLPVSGNQSQKITRGCSLLTSELLPGGRRRTPTLGLWGVWGTTKGPLRPRKPVPGGRRPSGKQYASEESGGLHVLGAVGGGARQATVGPRCRTATRLAGQRRPAHPRAAREGTEPGRSGRTVPEGAAPPRDTKGPKNPPNAPGGPRLLSLPWPLREALSRRPGGEAHGAPSFPACSSSPHAAEVGPRRETKTWSFPPDSSCLWRPPATIAPLQHVQARASPVVPRQDNVSPKGTFLVSQLGRDAPNVWGWGAMGDATRPLMHRTPLPHHKEVPGPKRWQ